MNDSSTGGFLLPTNDAPLNDEALDSLFQDFFAALTGLARPFVRERFTAEPQVPPDGGATWAAVGVIAIRDDQFAQQEMQADGQYRLTRHELLDVQCSFYGAMAQKAARMARNNILIAQNRDFIDAAGIVFMSASDPVKAPVLIQTRWANRIDVTFTFRRALVDTYAILSIEGADLTIATDTGPTRAVTVTSN